jgi:hypothetical protein
MPTIPTVFRPVLSRDVHLARPFLAYKSYGLNQLNYSAQGAQWHEAQHTSLLLNIDDPASIYPTNSFDGSNQYVHWSSIDHKYYRFPYDPGRTHEHSNVNLTHKNLHVSASIISIPYLEVGEKIKPGSVTITSTPVNNMITLNDDGNGNLRDPLIDTASFATGSNCFFYLTFNDTFRDFPYTTGQYATASIAYQLRGGTRQAHVQGMRTGLGIETTNQEDVIGLAGQFIYGSYGNAYLRIPHDPSFNQCTRCDNWTISFWIRNSGSHGYVVSKYGVRNERVLQLDGTFQHVDVYSDNLPDTNSGILSNDISTSRLPFAVSYATNGADRQFQFRSSNGNASLLITGSVPDVYEWRHVAIRNQNTVCQLFIDGIGYQSGSIPPDNVSNNADVMIGAISPVQNTSGTGSNAFIYTDLAELRMYDYPVSDIGINSLANRDFISGSCLQTNIAGNVFYRNGQCITSSPYPKYNSGSGFFGNTWQLDYRGAHTIYENEIMVRIPKDQLNISTNPTATWRPATAGSSCNTNGVLSGTAYTPASAEQNSTPGDYRKTMFLSGSAYPYITTVGLYNDKSQLLAVGKLARPLQKRDDIDTNIIIRWDY